MSLHLVFVILVVVGFFCEFMATLPWPWPASPPAPPRPFPWVLFSRLCWFIAALLWAF